jgi:hypothetical protein
MSIGHLSEKTGQTLSTNYGGTSVWSLKFEKRSLRVRAGVREDKQESKLVGAITFK